MTLGGSAQLNALVAMVVNPYEWDYIAEITGDSDWSSENMINKYQPLIENCQYCSDENSDTNKNGWLDISMEAYENSSSKLNITNPVRNSLFQTVSSQFTYNSDVNRNNFNDSWLYLPQSIDQNAGIRYSTYKRIKNVQSIRPSNFHVWTNSFVTKLIIDPTTKETCGVEYINGSNLYKANREIIISGGQWLTPQLLQLSGIGDRDLLRELDIEIIQDLPGVGKNQQEQTEIPYIVKLKPNKNLYGLNSPNCTFNTTTNDPCLIDYMNNPANSIYSSNLNFFGAFRSAEPVVKNDPDSIILFLPQRFTGIRGSRAEAKAAMQYPLGTYLSTDIELGRNQNNLGTIRIQSVNAFDTPLIEIKHFQSEHGQEEINKIIQHIRFLRRFVNDSELSQYVDYEDLPGSDIQTDEQLSEFIYKYAWGHHACCTTKMGNLNTDSLAVVNSKAQVKGIKNLRICDISIFPKIPGYYPMVPILIACEKIANDIIKDAQGPSL